jgi:hypothetical protein
LALALDQVGAQLRNRYRNGYVSYRLPDDMLPTPRPRHTDAEKASLAEALAAAAERIDDLNAARTHLRTAIDLLPADRKDELQRKLDALAAEQHRRATNSARQPAVKNAIEQTQVVRPRIPRSAQ